MAAEPRRVRSRRRAFQRLHGDLHAAGECAQLGRVGWVPPIRYAKSRGVSLAYQDLGEGPVTVLVILPLASNVEIAWESPHLRGWIESLASFSRVVIFDRRGTGASDRAERVPSIDIRADDCLAVMDAVGIERAFLYGQGEGGPTAMVLAATHPERTDGLILDATSALFTPGLGPAAANSERWGTDASSMVSLLAPSLAHDKAFSEWWQRYERMSASPAAVRELLEARDRIDVRDVLPRIQVPTLARHRIGDRVLAVQLARDTVAEIAGARLMEFAGDDHSPFAGGELDVWFEALRTFTGATAEYRPAAAATMSVAIRTFGGFAVEVGDNEVPLSAWGSRRARLLCKRLVAACGSPVPREQLTDLLWPDAGNFDRVRARLSAQLSTVRRILGGGVIADHASIRLDLERVQTDVACLHEAADAGDAERVVYLYRGEFLPEDPYDDWATGARERARSAFVAAARTLADTAAGAGNHLRALELGHRLLAADPFDDDAHRRVITALVHQRRLGDAHAAYRTYDERMRELGVTPSPHGDLLPVGPDPHAIGRNSEALWRKLPS